MGELAGVHDVDQPGLPRGSTPLPATKVCDTQRRRILRATIAIISELGYEAVTVADIVGSARVSRKDFYRQFSGKNGCFLAAIEWGREVVVSRLNSVDHGTSDRAPRERFRRALIEYLAVCASEPEYTRAWAMELPCAGPAGVAIRNAHHRNLAEILHDMAATTSAAHVPFELCLAAIGGCHELLFQCISERKLEDLRGLDVPMMSAVDRILGWKEGERS